MSVDLLLFLLSGAMFIGGLVWVIISSASGRRVGPAIAVMLASILVFFLAIATCAAGVISIFT